MSKKLKKRRKTYTREFKLEAVKQIVEGGRPLSEVADGLGLNRSVLGRWKAAFLEEGAVAFPGSGRQTPEQEEIRRLRRELAYAKQDLAFVKKAAAYFAKNSD